MRTQVSSRRRTNTTPPRAASRLKVVYPACTTPSRFFGCGTPRLTFVGDHGRYAAAVASAVFELAQTSNGSIDSAFSFFELAI